MKFIYFLYLIFILLSNRGISETITRKSEIFRDSEECLKDSQNPVCKNLIFKLEQMQIVEFEQNRFKCQTSILGLQTELIKAYYFNQLPKDPKGITTSYVIKNC